MAKKKIAESIIIRVGGGIREIRREPILDVVDTESDFDGSIAHDFEEDGGKTGSRIYYGVNYWLEPSAVLKLGAESTSIDNEEASHTSVPDDRIFLQLAFGF